RLVDRSVAALAAGVALGLYALASAAGAPAVLAGLLAAGLGVPALGAALPAGTIRLRAGQPAAVAFICCAAVAYFSVDAFLPLSLTSVHGSSVAAAGLILSTGTVFWAAGTWLQARLITRVSPRPLLAGGAVTLAAGVGSTGFVMTTAWVPFGLAAVSWALVALGMGITSSTATLVVLNWAGPGSEGRASAAAQLANLLGGAAGTGLAGLKIASATDRPSLTTDVRLVALAAFGFALVTAVASARARPAPASPNPSDPKGVREG
ncbi:MAG TPA: hypothetical protein VMB79_16555, partial [Jatrophihabitans sp.]|nr:hypothetical protein [Jatrophihabitans sp.]